MKCKVFRHIYKETLHKCLDIYKGTLPKSFLKPQDGTLAPFFLKLAGRQGHQSFCRFFTNGVDDIVVNLLWLQRDDWYPFALVPSDEVPVVSSEFL